MRSAYSLFAVSALALGWSLGAAYAQPVNAPGITDREIKLGANAP